MKKRFLLLSIVITILLSFSGCVIQAGLTKSQYRDVECILNGRSNTYMYSDYEEAISLLESYFEEENFTRNDYDQAVQIISIYVEEMQRSIEDALLEIEPQ